MVGGGYAMITGEVSAIAMLASLPYGLGVMTILTGKHIDQMKFDAEPRHPHSSRHDWRTGRARPEHCRARRHVRARRLADCLGTATPFAGAVVLALPRAAHAIEVLSRPRPAAPPAGYVGWPLWYHRACLEHNRIFGWAYIGGLAAGAVSRALTKSSF